MNEERELIGCLAALLRGESVPEPLPEAENNRLFRLCEKNGVTAMYAQAHGLEKTPPFHTAVSRAIARESAQTVYSRLFFQCLKQKAIPYMPLKGSVTKDWYGKPYWRYCADIDILLRQEQLPMAEEALASLGFQIKEQSRTQTAYFKPPITSIELHTSLFEEDGPVRNHFEQIWQHAIPDENGRLVPEPEEEYLYLLAHAAKHFCHGGTGLFPLMDVYLCKKRSQKDWDGEKLKESLNRTGLLSFHMYVEALTEEWFDGVSPSPEITETVDFLGAHILQSGLYGKSMGGEMILQNHFEKKRPRPGRRLRYILWRIFPDSVQLSRRYPRLEKFPWLLPYYWGKRIAEIRRENGNAGMARLWKRLSATKPAQSKKLEELFRQVSPPPEFQEKL